MDNKNNFFRSLLTLAIVLLALFVGSRLGKVTATADIAKQNKLAAILDYISKYYVDTISIDDLTEPIIPDILKELDPHSVYIPAASLQRSSEPLEGNFEGIGVTFNMPNDTVIIINVIADGPSAKAGINPGDRIIIVNDSVIAGKNIDQDSIMYLLKGKAGSKVQIKVKRKGLKDLLAFDITRGKVPLKSIDVAYMIAPTTGYIRMDKFARNTYSEFIQAVNNLHSQGMTSLIFDLRDNAGGILEQVNAITSELFTEKRLLVYTEGKAFPRKNVYSEGKGKCGKDTLIVLINENSASASEILAGAVQDNDRGIIIGHRSFGKGLVQQRINLSDNSELRLTIQRYYTPSGRSIQRPYGHGNSGLREYYSDLSRRYEDGELTNVDSIKHADTTKYHTLKGRVVYGGGGITPDIFVPYQMPNDYVITIRTHNLVYQYALDFGDKHRDVLNKIENISQLEQFFIANNPYEGFTNYVERAGVNSTNEEKENAKEILELYLKTYVGRTTYLGELGAVYFQNKFDKTVLKALEVIGNSESII